MTGYWELKKNFLEMYGYVCACCGEGNPAFLTLDHVQNDGDADRTGETIIIEMTRRDGSTYLIPHTKRRSTSQLWRAAIKEYRPDRYQILCFNCNFGRAKNNGICPHDQECPDMKAYRRGRNHN